MIRFFLPEMQVGDVVMVYLLKCTSIFVPLPRKKHHQVAGYSMSELCFKSQKQKQKPESLSHSLVLLGKMELIS